MKKIIIVPLLLILFSPAELFGQMFSVGDSEERQITRLGQYSTLGISWEFGDFDFTGEGVAPEDRADFQNSILRLRFENPGLHISAGFGGAITGMDDRSYVNINALLYNDLAFVRSERFILAIPIQIGTDLKSVNINTSNNSFQQSSLVLGTGLSMRYRATQRVDLSLRATPNLGFSFSQGALFGGRLFRGMSSARLYFNDVLGSNSLVFGYDFDYRDYNIDGDRDDYQYLSHSFTIGIAF